MAIVFDWYENPNASSEEEAALHPRIFMNGKVDTDTLCYKIHDYSSLTVGDVKNVLDNLSKILGESLREGKEVHIKQPSDAMKEGIILLPEDRQKEGLIMSWGLGRNVTLPTISKYAKKGFNDEKTERDLSKRLLEEVDTKAVDIFQPASSLSGGNQQKVVVAKALSQEMKVVIMDEPTKGVDVGAKAEIYAIMGDLAKKGYAIILISSEMPEILGMADRIVVMCNGRKTGELGRGEATQEMILELAMEKGTTGKGAAN